MTHESPTSSPPLGGSTPATPASTGRTVNASHGTAASCPTSLQSAKPAEWGHARSSSCRTMRRFALASRRSWRTSWMRSRTIGRHSRLGPSLQSKSPLDTDRWHLGSFALYAVGLLLLPYSEIATMIVSCTSGRGPKSRNPLGRRRMRSSASTNSAPACTAPSPSSSDTTTDTRTSGVGSDERKD